MRTQVSPEEKIDKKWSSRKREDGETILERQGRYAKNCVGNAIELTLHKFRSGSGAEAFGGVKNWPGLTLRIDFEFGQESKRNEFAKKLQKLIDEEM